jgi:hypothetical protein
VSGFERTWISDAVPAMSEVTDRGRIVFCLKQRLKWQIVPSNGAFTQKLTFIGL